MADYKESTVAGTSWIRACRVVIENPYQQAPSVMFVEERAINLGDQIITQLQSNVSCAFDPAATFPLLDPLTGEVSTERPEITHGELYAVLNSLYMHLATQRDAAQTEVAP